MILYVCEPSLWALDAPGYCEGDVMRDRWTDARCHLAPLHGPPAHVWRDGAWRAPVTCEGVAGYVRLDWCHAC